MESFTCPKCGKEQPVDNRECIQCGVIFNKIKDIVKEEIQESPEEPMQPPDEIDNNKNKNQPFKRIDKGCAISLTIIISFAAFLFATLYWLNKDMPDDISPRKKQIQRSFNENDNSHIELTKFIKASMNDPDSYEHVETKYGDKEDFLIVKTTFRGKNAFGGVVTNWISAKCDLDGRVLEIIDQGP